MQTTLFELDSPVQRSFVPTLGEIEYFTDAELMAARNSVLFFDVETYPNYFLVAFKSVQTGKVLTFESSPERALHLEKLAWVLENFTVVGFNSRAFDLPIITLAFRMGTTPQYLKIAANQLIEMGNTREWLQAYSLELPKLDHIDLISVAPLEGSLKIYSGRLHCRRMQDLPYEHDKPLTAEQAKIVYHYCINDLDNTALLWEELQPQIQLRREMSAEYGQDLRSLSDAQVAERVLCSEMKALTGNWPRPPKFNEALTIRYQVPSFLRFQTEQLQAVLERVRNSVFTLNGAGAPMMPPELNDFTVTIGRGRYRMGIGGLHSSEQNVHYHAGDGLILLDRDVASYYPSIILNQELYPKHLGTAFLEVYREIVRRRLEAKRNKDKVRAESLKIAINGSFGKLGSMYSALYSPDLLLQVTLTGQLALLMLIEAIELAGIVEVSPAGERRCEVVSANTDGIVILCPESAYETLQTLILEWEMVTGFQTEETRYAALYSRDVNNYIAVKPDGKTKTKGAYAHPWAEPGRNIFKLHKNPQNLICIEAVTAYLTQGVPVATTIGECKDLTRFLTVRNVRGGAHKDGVYLGKTVRWYYSTAVSGPIRYVTSGNQVPRSVGAMPLMDLSDFPADIDYSWYEAEALAILVDLSVLTSTEASFKVEKIPTLQHLKTFLKNRITEKSDETSDLFSTECTMF